MISGGDVILVKATKIVSALISVTISVKFLIYARVKLSLRLKTKNWWFISVNIKPVRQQFNES
jgi:hypothetical protein